MLSAALQSVHKVARHSSWHVSQQLPLLRLTTAAHRHFRMQPNALPAPADAVLAYWFGPDYAQQQPPGYWSPVEISKLWFKGGPEVDQYITEQFAADIKTLAAGGYDDWMQQPMAAVAGIVLADQFTRNVYRGSAQMYALDGKALQWSAHVRTAFDVHTALPSAPLRYFSYMPLMHSEELKDQQLLVQLVDDELAAVTKTDPESAAAKFWADIKRFAEAHMKVVERWGRFPHRNALLGRTSTPEEEAGLQDGSIPKW